MTQPRALAFAPINVICSVQAEGPGEALAQLMAEKANPKTDLWFSGIGDPHLQAAELDLSHEYKNKSPNLASLHPGAHQQAAQSRYRTVGTRRTRAAS